MGESSVAVIVNFGISDFWFGVARFFRFLCVIVF